MPRHPRPIVPSKRNPQRGCPQRAFVWLLVAALAWLFTAVVPSIAQTSRLLEFLPSVGPADLVPGADRLGPPEGSPPVAPAYTGQQRIGYVYLNTDVVSAVGYSGKPINILVGLDINGRIAGARLVEHHEPIVLVGIPPERITRFINGYVGRDAREISAVGARPPVDIVSGATVTVMVIGDSILRSATRVARKLELGGAAQQGPVKPIRTIDATRDAIEDWATLVADGSVRRLHLTVGEVSDAFAHDGHLDAAARPELDDPAQDFIDMHVAPVSVPSIGRSLLGDAGYTQLQRDMGPDQQAIAVFSNGPYSFKGSGYVRGGIFDRFELLQGDQSVRFRDRMHRRLGGAAAAGAPDFTEADLFIVPTAAGINLAEPWRLQLLVQRTTTGRDKAFLTFDLAYDLPTQYLLPVAAAPVAAQPIVTQAGVPHSAGEPGAAPEEPLWHTMWRAKVVDLSILIAALGCLTGIFFFQDWFTSHPVLYDRVRLGFMVFTLLWIGWYAQAQLSVVNVLAFISSLRTDFNWDYFLMAPLIFVLWFATAASILFWNRGAFCGWLCPFGALQELLNRAARLVKIPQLRIPFGVHQRLVALKYIVFLLLFGISLSALATAERAAEVEPFKTAIILRFVRDWPFVLYAVAILAASLTVERFFCRYMCPLGAALAIPARLRMFDWLRRYRECGNPCQRCANDCPVQAIHPEGHINPNECIQCLHCQMLYHHDHKCPVMIQRRLKREKFAASGPPPTFPTPPMPRPSVRQTRDASV
jgi:NosR/NirI family transcriptional regulator, nitrous oxide reductase regulator